MGVATIVTYRSDRMPLVYCLLALRSLVIIIRDTPIIALLTSGSIDSMSSSCEQTDAKQLRFSSSTVLT